MKLRTTIAALTATLMLTACGGAPSVDKLKSDPELLKKTLQECGKKYKTKEEGMKDKACANAVEAVTQMMKERMNQLKKSMGK